jgi:hypothetical protein
MVCSRDPQNTRNQPHTRPGVLFFHGGTLDSKRSNRIATACLSREQQIEHRTQNTGTHCPPKARGPGTGGRRTENGLMSGGCHAPCGPADHLEPAALPLLTAGNVRPATSEDVKTEETHKLGSVFLVTPLLVENGRRVRGPMRVSPRSPRARAKRPTMTADNAKAEWENFKTE